MVRPSRAIVAGSEHVGHSMLKLLEDSNSPSSSRVQLLLSMLCLSLILKLLVDYPTFF